MPVPYALFKNHVTSEEHDYAAQVQTVASADVEDITRRIVDQGSTVTEPDIKAVLEGTVQAVESLLIEGYRVNLGGLVELFPRIKGVFNGQTDAFDPARHSVDVGANPGRRVRKAVREQATVEKQESIKPLSGSYRGSVDTLQG